MSEPGFEPSVVPDLPEADLALAAQHEIEEKFRDVELPRQFDIPPINALAFGANGRMVHDFTQRLEHWLTFPYIQDIFEKNHTARRQWRREFKQYGETGQRLLEPWLKNKYRANILTGPNVLIDTMTMIFESGSPAERKLAQRLLEIWDEKVILGDLERYLEMETDEKRAAARQLEDKVVEVLKAISEASQQLAVAAK